MFRRCRGCGQRFLAVIHHINTCVNRAFEELGLESTGFVIVRFIKVWLPEFKSPWIISAQTACLKISVAV